MDLEMKFLGSVVLLVAENLADVAPQLTTCTHIRVVEVPLPSYQERLEFIKHLLNLPGKEEEKPKPRQQLVNKLKLAPNLSPERFAAITAGLGLIDIHDLALKAEEKNQPITEEMTLQRKYEAILYRSRGLLELIRPRMRIEDLAGLDHVERYFRTVIEMLMRGDAETPMGVLLIGPPGTGKTATVEVLANALVVHRAAPDAVGGNWPGVLEPANLVYLVDVEFVEEAARCPEEGRAMGDLPEHLVGVRRTTAQPAAPVHPVGADVDELSHGPIANPRDHLLARLRMATHQPGRDLQVLLLR